MLYGIDWCQPEPLEYQGIAVQHILVPANNQTWSCS